MAGTLCLADVQLTAFQAYKKLIRLKIEFVAVNCQEYCQHFQPRSAPCTTNNHGRMGQPLAGPVLGRKGNGGRLTNELRGIRRGHGRGLAWLVPGEVVEDSHTWSCVHLPGGLKPASHIHGDLAEAICVCNQFISNASLIPLLSFQITTQSKAPELQRVREIPEPRENCEVPEPPVTLSSGYQEDALQEDLWSHGAEANAAMCSPDAVGDSVSAEEGVAWRGGIAPGARLPVPPGLGQPGRARSPAPAWAAAAGCYSYLGI